MVTDAGGTPSGAARRRVPVDVLVVGAVLLAAHVAVRNFGATDLNHELSALDLGITTTELALVHAGGAPYTDVRTEYGPYWLAYFRACFSLFGVSLGAVQWGIAGAAWLRSLATYVLVARLVSRRWAVFAVACTFGSAGVVYSIPWAGHLVAPLYLLLAAALMAATAPAAPARRWAVVGICIGILLSTRSASGALALAMSGLAAGATGRLHPPVRHGHLVGTVLVPAALVASLSLLLWGWPLSLGVAFGVPVAAGAVLAGAESWRRRDTGPQTWRVWAAPVAACGAGILAAMLPWLLPMSADYGLLGALHNVYLRIFVEYPLGDITNVTPFRIAGYGTAPLPPLPLLACLALVAAAGALHLFGGARPRPRLMAGLVFAGAVIIASGVLREGATRTVGYVRHVHLWLLPMAFTAWAVVRVVRRPAATASPAWLVPLACVAGVAMIDGAPNADWGHMSFAQSPMLVLAVAVAGLAWQGSAHTRALRVAAGTAILVAVAILAVPVARLWYQFPRTGWRLERREQVWLDLPRAQVWDGVESARELSANVAYIAAQLPPGAPLFEFPTTINLFLSGREPAGGVAYFLAGFTGAVVDERYATLLRDDPPPLAVVRFDPAGWILLPAFVADGFPRITGALETEYRPIHTTGVTHFYVPVAPHPGAGAAPP